MAASKAPTSPQLSAEIGTTLPPDLRALHQELATIRQLQSEQLVVLQQIERELRTVRWWRRFWATLRMILLLLVIGAALYLWADWPGLLHSLSNL